MKEEPQGIILNLLQKYEQDILNNWIKEQMSAPTLRLDLMSEKELRHQSSDFLKVLIQSAKSGNIIDISAPEWIEMRDLLSNISRARVEQGFSSSEAATFVFSFKKLLFEYLGQEIVDDQKTFKAAIWATNTLLDKLGLFVTERYQINREKVINRLQKELLELSTPVVKLWEGILALPLIGTLDSERTQVLMESLLNKIEETGSTIAIIDITGVPTVDTLVAQHLLKTISAARLMGADCIISGIRPQIAQTIVQVGVNLTDVVTKASLADALTLALKRIGVKLGRLDTSTKERL